MTNETHMHRCLDCGKNIMSCDWPDCTDEGEHWFAQTLCENCARQQSLALGPRLPSGRRMMG